MFPTSVGAPAAGARGERETRSREIAPVASPIGVRDQHRGRTPSPHLELAGRSVRPVHTKGDQLPPPLPTDNEDQHTAATAASAASHRAPPASRRDDRSPSPAARPSHSGRARPHAQPRSASPSPSPIVPRSTSTGGPQPIPVDEQKFERWRQGLERYVAITSHRDEQQQELPPSSSRPLSAKAPIVSNGTPHPVAPSTKPPSVNGAPPTRVAPSSLAKSALSTLHKKVRAPSAPTAAAKHPPHPANPRAFERLSHGLSSHDPREAQLAPPHPLRSSLEDMESAFLSRLAQWTTSEPNTGDAPPKPAQQQVRSPPRNKRVARPISAAAPAPVAISSVESEEDAIRARARQLQADLAALAHRKRASQLAEAAASMRVQMRTQLEDREASLRDHMSQRVQQAREAREVALDGCTRLQRDLADKIAALQRMHEQVGQQAREVELGFEGAMEELTREYSHDVDTMYQQASSDMEARLQQLTRQMHGEPPAPTPTPSAAPTTAAPPPPTDHVDTPWGALDPSSRAAPRQRTTATQPPPPAVNAQPRSD